MWIADAAECRVQGESEEESMVVGWDRREHKSDVYLQRTYLARET